MLQCLCYTYSLFSLSSLSLSLSPLSLSLSLSASGLLNVSESLKVLEMLCQSIQLLKWSATDCFLTHLSHCLISLPLMEIRPPPSNTSSKHQRAYRTSCKPKIQWTLLTMLSLPPISLFLLLWPSLSLSLSFACRMFQTMRSVGESRSRIPVTVLVSSIPQVQQDHPR